MRPLLTMLALLTAIPALAKPWNGIEPGVSRREDVLSRFGKPSQTVTSAGKEVLGYLGKQAIKGTSQAQFKVDPATRLVERIDVFPGPVISEEAVRDTYGKPCPAGPQGSEPCFVRKLTDDFRTYYAYSKLGLAVFLNEDGQTVHSFVFHLTPKAGR